MRRETHLWIIIPGKGWPHHVVPTRHLTEALSPTSAVEEMFTTEMLLLDCQQSINKYLYPLHWTLIHTCVPPPSPASRRCGQDHVPHVSHVSQLDCISEILHNSSNCSNSLVSLDYNMALFSRNSEQKSSMDIIF